jgi:hypothetical protein
MKFILTRIKVFLDYYYSSWSHYRCIGDVDHRPGRKLDYYVGRWMDERETSSSLEVDREVLDYLNHIQHPTNGCIRSFVRFNGDGSLDSRPQEIPQEIKTPSSKILDIIE